jgi:predicted nucleotidyltransferase component of viral defense system
VEAKVMTSFQVMVLTTLFESALRGRDYYFTGGTALAEFYLQHRHSDDLDVFTRGRRNIRTDYLDVKRALEDKALEVSSEIEEDEFVRFFVSGAEEKRAEKGLKVELGRYAGPQMTSEMSVENIVVDSFEDIAVNKVCAIYGRSEVKDFVDLFFILRESEFTLDYLAGRAKEKEADFDREDTVLEFATKLLGVKELHLHKIRMIKPVTMEDLQSCFVPKAEALIQRLRPAGHS